ncbi:MAG: RecX family transcriptional regulator [Candidatus Gracilibacteria bacterium]|nr:RecX family transcriptional regulator [Candidatus Gracilibacteria bacterium]
MSKILTTESSLLNYAAWYAMRYFPSLAKLREALMKKSANAEPLVSIVMAEMGQYICEERTVDGLVRMYTEQSKTRPYIEQKLKAKKFQIDIIEITLEAYGDTFISWNNYENTITRKIQDLLTRNRSRRYISGALTGKYPNFKQEIYSLIETLCPDETEAIRSEFEKLCKKHDTGSPKERQKIIAKLLAKGFPYDKVRNVVF